MRFVDIVVVIIVLSVIFAITIACIGIHNAPKQESNTVPNIVNNEPLLPVNNINSEATLPGQTVQFENVSRLGNISIDSTVWIYPWTMWVTSDGKYYINGYHKYFTDKPSEPQNYYIRVTRVNDGFKVFLDDTKFEWTPVIYTTDVSRYDSFAVISIK